MVRYILQFENFNLMNEYVSHFNFNYLDSSRGVNSEQSNQIIHKLHNFSILIISIDEDISVYDSLPKHNTIGKDDLRIEPDVTFHLTVEGIRDILNIDVIDRSIFGPFTGELVKLALIDGGIDDLNPDLLNTSIKNKVLLDGINFDKINDFIDLGHGTAMAGLICGSGASSNEKYIGIAPKIELYDLIAFNKEKKGFLGDILASIDYAINEGIRIVAMPFSASNKLEPSLIFKFVLEQASKNANLIFCAGTGNDGPGSNTIGMPGIYESVITTAFTDQRFTVSHKSGRGTLNGNKPDFCLPGTRILSLNTFSSYYKDRIYDSNEFYAMFTGSSVAVAILTGIIAKIININPLITSEQVKEILINSTTKMRNQLKSSVGHGLLNPLLLFKNLDKLFAFRSIYPRILKDAFYITISIIFFLISISQLLKFLI